MSVRSSLAFNFGANYIKLVLGFVSSVILARLLSPEEFGIYSIAASVGSFGYMFRNFGVNQFLIQTDELTSDRLRTAFAITLIISWLIGLTFLVTAGPLGLYYGNTGISEVLVWLSLNFFILPFGSVSAAILRRQMQFDKLALIEVVSAIAGLIVGVSVAFKGGSYMSIVWGTNVSTLLIVLLNFYFRPAGLPWLPSLKAWNEVASFGLRVGFADFVKQSGDSATDLIIGKVKDLASVGLYSRAYGALKLFDQLFYNGISPLILPYLAEAQRSGENIPQLYCRILSYTTIFAVPFYAVMYCLATDLMLVIFGDQWIDSAAILEYMCIAAPVGVLTLYLDQLYLSQGKAKKVLRIQVVGQISRLIAVFVLIGYGLEFAALSLAAFGLARLIYGLLTSVEFRKALLLSSLDLAKALVLAIVLVASFRLVHPIYADLSSLLVIAGFGLFSLVLWLIAIYAMAHPVRTEIEQIIKKVLG